MQIETKSSETDVEIYQFQQIGMKRKQKVMKRRHQEAKPKQKSDETEQK